MDKHGQLTIFDYFKKEPLKMPEFDYSKMHGFKGLDEYTDAYPETPIYFVTKGYGSPLFYDACICIYVGYWHAISGWNIDDKIVKSYELIKGFTYKDFSGTGHPKLNWTPDEYEAVKGLSVKEIIEMITHK